MVKDKQLNKANKKVNKALGVFSDAITAVLSAQEDLKAGISADYTEIDAIHGSIKALQNKIVTIEAGMREKEDSMVANNDLLDRLSKFKVEGADAK